MNNVITKIRLSVPGSTNPDRYFSFQLKHTMANEPSVFGKPGKIFVLSGIDGHFKSFCRLLIKARVINKRLHWNFEDNHLVIVGDCFYLGEQAIECLWLIYSLEEEAKKKGGYVHFILGNSEVINMNGMWRFVHPNYAIHTKSMRPHVALYDGNNELCRWLHTKNVMEKIGDILFVHAGIAYELLQFGLSVTQINNYTRPYYTRANESFADPLLSFIYNSQNSPLTYLGYYQNSVTEQQIDVTLNYFGIRKIITGHTLEKQISSYYNGKVINVNTDHASGNSEGLLISGHRFYRILSDGKTERMK